MRAARGTVARREEDDRQDGGRAEEREKDDRLRVGGFKEEDDRLQVDRSKKG
jgi:hypothetical protein